MQSKKNKNDAIDIIREHIETGSFAKLYLLFGEERYLVNLYRDKLLAAVTDVEDNINFSKHTGSKFNRSEVISFCSELPFLADRRVALIEGSGLFKSSCEEFAEDVAGLPAESVLIFVETEVDKRNKLYKTVSKYGAALEFGKPDERTMLIWTKRQFKNEGRQAEDAAIYKLIEYIGCDMNAVNNEIEKLISYTEGRDVVTAEDVEALCIGKTWGKIFDMVDAIAGKQQQKALDIYYELLENREPFMRILYLITRQFDMMLKTRLAKRDGLSDSQIAAAIGVPQWSVKKYINQVRNYEPDMLLDMLGRCHELDYMIKTGQTGDQIAVETLIIELSK